MAVGWRKEYLRYKDFFLNILNVYKQRADLKAFFEIILSLSTVTVFILFALKPTVLTIIDLTKEIDEKEKMIAGLDLKLNNLRAAQNVYIQNQDAIADIEKAVPTKPEPNAFVRQVEGLVGKNSVKVMGISIGEAVLVGADPLQKRSQENKPLPGDAKEMSASISVSGDYKNLYSFVKDLENLRISNKIDTLTISSSLTDVGRVIVAVISGRVPYITQ